jgi:hypothetical protein
MPFWTKRHSFGHFRILVFFFFFLNNKEGNFYFLFKKRESGWLQPGMGWPKPPLGPWGWSGHPKRPKKKKKRKEKKKKETMSLAFGVAGPPLRAWGRLRPPLLAVAPPKSSNPFFFFAFEGGRTTP